MPQKDKQLYIYASFFAIYVIWGSTYMLNKLAVQQLAPLYLAAIRFFTSGVLMLIICKVLGFKITVTKKQLLNSIAAGCMFLAYGNGIFVWALKYVDSGFGALLVAVQPLIIVLLMKLLFNKKIQSRSLIGIALGIAGIALLVFQKNLVINSNSYLGIGMIFSCIIVWSLASIFVSKASLPGNFLVDAGFQMLAGGTLLAIGSFVAGEEHLPVSAWTTNSKIAMVLLTIFGSIIAFTAFNYLLKNVSPEKVATSGYVNPIIAFILGWYILDEHITLQTAIAAIILLTGVYFINTSKAKVAKAELQKLKFQLKKK